MTLVIDALALAMLLDDCKEVTWLALVIRSKTSAIDGCARAMDAVAGARGRAAGGAAGRGARRAGRWPRAVGELERRPVMMAAKEKARRGRAFLFLTPYYQDTRSGLE